MISKMDEMLVTHVDDEYADQLADSVIEQRGYEGAAADRARRVIHNFLVDLAEQLRPGSRLSLDVFHPSEPPSGLYLERTEDALVIKKASLTAKQTHSNGHSKNGRVHHVDTHPT